MEDSREICSVCGNPLPANYPMMAHSSCMTKRGAARSGTPVKKKVSTKVKELGGVCRFREQGTLDEPKWAVRVFIFDHIVYGDGYTKEIAIGNAVAKLPPNLAKLFL